MPITFILDDEMDSHVSLWIYNIVGWFEVENYRTTGLTYGGQLEGTFSSVFYSNYLLVFDTSRSAFLEINEIPYETEPFLVPYRPPFFVSPHPLPPMSDCCNATLRLVRQIHKWIVADPKQKIKVPKTLSETPPEKGWFGGVLDRITPDKKEITSLPDLLLWINEQNINYLGQWGQVIEIPRCRGNRRRSSRNKGVKTRFYRYSNSC